MKLKYCKECKWSKIVTDPYDKLYCTNSNVNANDPWALSAINIKGRECTDERRDISWFGVACGIKGKLFEIKVGNPFQQPNMQ